MTFMEACLKLDVEITYLLLGGGCYAANSGKYDWNTSPSIFCCNSYHRKFFINSYSCLLGFIFLFIYVLVNYLPLVQVAENLAQLMYSVMMTGYMFSNAQYRLELQESLEQVALPEVKDKKVNLFLWPPFSVTSFYTIVY